MAVESVQVEDQRGGLGMLFGVVVVHHVFLVGEVVSVGVLALFDQVGLAAVAGRGQNFGDEFASLLEGHGGEGLLVICERVWRRHDRW